MDGFASGEKKLQMLGATTRHGDSHVEEEPACPAGRQRLKMRLFQQIANDRD